MNEPSEPVAAQKALGGSDAKSCSHRETGRGEKGTDQACTASDGRIEALTSRIKRLEARVGAYEAFLDTLASDARFFANAQKKALLEGGGVLCHDG